MKTLTKKLFPDLPEEHREEFDKIFWDYYRDYNIKNLIKRILRDRQLYVWNLFYFNSKSPIFIKKYWETMNQKKDFTQQIKRSLYDN